MSTTFNAPTNSNQWSDPLPMVLSDGKTPGTEIGTSFEVSATSGQNSAIEGTSPVIVDVVLSDAEHTSLDLVQNGLAGLLLVGKLTYDGPSSRKVVFSKFQLRRRARSTFHGKYLYLRRIDDLGGSVTVTITSPATKV